MRNILIFGSQTGQSKSIAEGIHAVCIEANLKCSLTSFDRMQVKDLEAIKNAFLIVATTGDGDMPDSCLKFFRDFRKMDWSGNHLASLSFGLLALGDTNYSNFCGGGKAVESLLLAKGARYLFKTIYGDDAVGFEDQVDEFTTNVLNILKAAPLMKDNEVFSSHEEDKVSQDDRFHLLDHPFLYGCNEFRPSEKSIVKNTGNLKLPIMPKSSMLIKFFSLPSQPQGDNAYFGMASPLYFYPLKEINRISGQESKKCTLLVQIEGEIDYQPGDSFSVVLPNNAEMVGRLLERLQVAHIADIPMQRSCLVNSSKSGSSFNHIPEITTLRYIFLYCVDFASMPFKKAFFLLLSQYAHDEADFNELLLLSSRQGAEKYNKLREEMLTLEDILNLFKSCHPPVERIIENLPILLPRPYSFASSPLESNKCFSFVYNVVNIDQTERRRIRKGVATGWMEKYVDNLHDQFMAVKIPLFLRSNTSFRMPEDPSIPMILIGPGTGVAPFIGFLRHRKLARDLNKESQNFGPVYLLFGCRTRLNDFLFEEELNSFKENGILSELLVCFSRDADSSDKYVQDMLRKDYEKFGDLIMNKKAHVYICGDALNMAKDVNEALIDVVQNFMSISNGEARSLVIKMRQDPKQIKEDVWT